MAERLGHHEVAHHVGVGVALLVTAIVWIARRQLSRHRVRGLLLAFGLAILLGQQGFLEDPIGVLSFLGIALDRDGLRRRRGRLRRLGQPRLARCLPRVSRVLMYVGYTLFAGRARQLGARDARPVEHQPLHRPRRARRIRVPRPAAHLPGVPRGDHEPTRPGDRTARTEGAAAADTHGGSAAAAEHAEAPAATAASGGRQLACSASLMMVGVRECPPPP